jgi:hypothetical protein
LISKTGERAAVAGGIAAGHQQSARLNERALELDLLLDSELALRTRLIGEPFAAGHIVQGSRRRERIQEPRLKRGRIFEY